MNILTINAEDWYNGFVPAEDKDWDRFEYRVEKMLIPMLNELDLHGVKAIVFCTGWLAEKHPTIVREIALRGHQIGCNGYWHIEPTVMTIDTFRSDTLLAKQVLERAAGQPVMWFRGANFSMDSERLKVLEELHFHFDSSLIGNKPYPLGELTEYPVAKYKGKVPFAGGGFFRIMPYGLIRKFMNEMDYVLTYFHPRDFDTYQPLWPGLGLKDRFLCKVGVSTAFGKFQKVLKEFKFDNI